MLGILAERLRSVGRQPYPRQLGNAGGQRPGILVVLMESLGHFVQRNEACTRAQVSCQPFAMTGQQVANGLMKHSSLLHLTIP